MDENMESEKQIYLLKNLRIPILYEITDKISKIETTIITFIKWMNLDTIEF
jgi:hypothetical protein